MSKRKYCEIYQTSIKTYWQEPPPRRQKTAGKKKKKQKVKKEKKKGSNQLKVINTKGRPFCQASSLSFKQLKRRTFPFKAKPKKKNVKRAGNCKAKALYGGIGSIHTTEITWSWRHTHAHRDVHLLRPFPVLCVCIRYMQRYICRCICRDWKAI